MPDMCSGAAKLPPEDLAKLSLINPDARLQLPLCPVTVLGYGHLNLSANFNGFFWGKFTHLIQNIILESNFKICINSP
jgi:hypothetical protein